jgi:hypothetical protein
MINLKIKNTRIYFLLMAFAFALLYTAYFLSLDLHITYLRAENALLLNAVYASGQELWNFCRSFLFNSYNGHFTPIPFSLELLQSRLFGTHETLWLMRQMLVIGILSASIYSLFIHVLCTEGSKKTAVLIASGATLIFIFQPTMLALVSWPLLAFQFILIAMMMYATQIGFNYAWQSNPKLLRNVLLISYATMHVFGAGLAISLSALFIGMSLLLLRHVRHQIDKRDLMNGLCWLAITTLLILIHALLMMRNIKSPSDGGVYLSLPDHFLRFGWLWIESFQPGI